MSMTLILWKAPVVDDPDDAQELLKAWCDTGDDSSFEPSGDIALVAEELRRLYPWRDLSNEETVVRMSEEERSRYRPEVLKELKGVDGGDAWAEIPFDQSDRLLALEVRWGADDAVIAAIVALARKFELVLYDPQGPDVFLPTDPIEELTEFPGFKLLDWLKIGAMVVALSALTYGAWLLPIGWVRWPLAYVIGFIAAAAWFVFILMMFGRRIMEGDQDSKS
jgi:hypothetical protein